MLKLRKRARLTIINIIIFALCFGSYFNVNITNAISSSLLDNSDIMENEEEMIFYDDSIYDDDFDVIDETDSNDYQEDDYDMYDAVAENDTDGDYQQGNSEIPTNNIDATADEQIVLYSNSILDILTIEEETSLLNDLSILAVPVSNENLVNIMAYGAVGDGITNDYAAFKKALNEAQKSSGTIYFPNGTYNLDGNWQRLENYFGILGESKDGVTLITPPAVTCKDDISIKNITIINNRKELIGVYPDKFIGIDIDNVNVRGVDDSSSYTAQFIVAGVNSLSKGVNTLNITNCNITNQQGAIRLSCRVDCKEEGLIANNTITNLGKPEQAIMVYAILLGGNTSGNGQQISNVMIENNVIENVHAKFRLSDSSDLGVVTRGILVYGENVTIQNNILKNISSGAASSGIYVKGRYAKILDNTLIDAGDKGSITVKGTYANAASSDVLIKNNTIEFSKIIDWTSLTSGITIQGSGYTIENNKINVNRNIGIGLSYTKEGVVKGNVIEMSYGYAAINSQLLGANLSIIDNDITFAPSDTADAAIVLKSSSSPDCNIVVSENTITTISGKAINTYSLTEGVTAQIFKNTFNLAETNADVITLNSLSCKFYENVINYAPTAQSKPRNANSTIISTLNTGKNGEQIIQNNTFVCSGTNSPYFMKLSAAVKGSPPLVMVSDNKFVVGSDCKFDALIGVYKSSTDTVIVKNNNMPVIESMII